MILFLFLFLSAVNLYSQPSWRSPAAPPAGAGAQATVPAGEAASSPKVVYRSRIVRDTLRLVDTVRVVDTIRDTIPVFPVQYRYRIHYALTSLNVEISNPEWLDYASYSEIVARDTAMLRIGSEDVRTLGSIIDQFGNKIPQQDIITTGFTINVRRDMAVIEYRGKNSVALFSGSFDLSGFLIATGEISETGILASFWPFSWFFGTSKKRIIIEITREAYL